jgi:hypothetical protein
MARIVVDNPRRKGSAARRRDRFAVESGPPEKGENVPIEFCEKVKSMDGLEHSCTFCSKLPKKLRHEYLPLY